MAPISVYKVIKEGGQSELFGAVSCKPDESFHDLRRKLEEVGTFPFPFQFIDSLNDCRMDCRWEKLNIVTDWGNKVLVIPVQQSDLPSTVQWVSSNASNWCSEDSAEQTDPGTNQGSSEALDNSNPSTSIPLEDSNEADNTIGVQTPHIDLLSVFMNPLHRKIWQREAVKLQQFMNSNEAFKEQQWSVKTWDDGDTAMGKIHCLECDHWSDGSSKGIMERSTITNCFTNFRTKHILTTKHKENVSKRTRLALEATTIVIDERAILNEHIAILGRVNAAQEGDEATFVVMGDVNREPLLLKLFRARCCYCFDQFTLVPKQRNLEYNLSQHCASVRHIDAFTSSQRKARGEPALSGRVGRPRASDKRDVRQRTIGLFFGSNRGGDGQTSQIEASSIGKGKGDDDSIHLYSLLCWGLWQSVLGTIRQARPIKEIVKDLHPGREWYSEPHAKVNVFNLTRKSQCEVEGTFRHKNCSRVSIEGGGFQDMTCEHCWSIQKQPDFRLRVYRESHAVRKRGNRDTSYGLRLGYMTTEEIVQQGRFHSGTIRQRNKQVRIQQHRILMLQTRVPRLKEICHESLTQREVRRFCNSIILAHRTGAFGGREALWDLMRDIAHNVNRSKQGLRYSKGTKVICQALYQHGGRRVVDCLSDNLIGPSLTTLQRDRRGMTYFRAGFHKDQFQFIGDVYHKLKVKLGIEGPLPCMLAEDETCIKKTVRWLPKQDSMLGFCGKKEDHVCIPGFEVKVGDGESGFNNITTAFEENVVGHQARVMIVNPLHSKMPRLCLMATSTCNKFDAGWVREQWILISDLWNTHCLDLVGPLLGHASDGDSRRRKLMLEDYSGQRLVERREGIGWEGWPLTHSLVSVRRSTHASGLHDQDFIHNTKKLVNPLDSTAKTLKLGAGLADISHLIQLYKVYSIHEHGLTQEDIKRTDRQNWASAQRLCSRKVISCLKDMRTRRDARKELCTGSEVYLTICADYVDIFLNGSLTLRERVTLCGKVSFFLRLWRLWIFHGNHAVGGNRQPITMNNCVSMQTFLDVQMSMHFVVLLIIQFRDRYSQFPVPLHLTGSDSCEQFFSKVGGMRGHERSYDLCELVDCVTSLNRLVTLELTDGLHGVGKSHKKHRNIWMTIHYGESANHQLADLSDYTGIATNEEIIVALKEGLKLAQQEASVLEMNPSTSCRDKVWWDSPWLIESKGSKYGGWCDIRCETLPPCLDIPEAESLESNELSSMPLGDEEFWPTDSATEVEVNEGEMHEVMSSLFDELQSSPTDLSIDVKPMVSVDGKNMYKSTLVAELAGNPSLSKDRLTRVKQTAYFNNLVDKPKVRAGIPTMFMAIGMDCGVFFVEDLACTKELRSRNIAKAIAGVGRKHKEVAGPSRPAKKRSKGNAAPVSIRHQGEKYVWWIGRVQNIRKKYNGKWGRCREAIDLLDRPGTEDEATNCEIQFNWFTPFQKNKFKYDMCDPQWISLESVISTVCLSVKPDKPEIYLMDLQDAKLLDDFVSEKN